MALIRSGPPGSVSLAVCRQQQSNRGHLAAGDAEKLVKGLQSKGVTFEHYQLPGLTLKGDIRGEIARAAWFKDPNSNIHALVTAEPR